MSVSFSGGGHLSTAFLETVSSCGQGKGHNDVIGWGGYWGVTLLSLSGRFKKFLEERSKTGVSVLMVWKYGSETGGEHRVQQQHTGRNWEQAS